MNLHTHRINTTPEDAEAWADAQVSRRRAVLYDCDLSQPRPGVIVATPRAEARFRGLTYQGRYDEPAHTIEEAVTETKIADGAHAASYVGHEDDAEAARPMTDDEFGELLGSIIGWSMLAVVVSIIVAVVRS